MLTPEEQNVSDADVLALEQAKQNVNFGFTINPLIQQYINYYQGRGRSTMESGPAPFGSVHEDGASDFQRRRRAG